MHAIHERRGKPYLEIRTGNIVSGSIIEKVHVIKEWTNCNGRNAMSNLDSRVSS
jgi:hypothetical protein